MVELLEICLEGLRTITLGFQEELSSMGVVPYGVYTLSFSFV
jgi:hypothetical protein